MPLTGKNKKILKITFRLIIVFGLLFVFNINPADAAFKHVDRVINSPESEKAVYEGLNCIGNIVKAVGGLIILVCLIYTGIRLSTAQGNSKSK